MHSISIRRWIKGVCYTAALLINIHIMNRTFFSFSASWEENLSQHYIVICQRHELCFSFDVWFYSLSPVSITISRFITVIKKMNVCCCWDGASNASISEILVIKWIFVVIIVLVTFRLLNLLAIVLRFFFLSWCINSGEGNQCFE